MKRITIILLALSTTLSAQIVNTIPATLANGHIISCLPDTIMFSSTECNGPAIGQGVADPLAQIHRVHYKIGKPCCFWDQLQPQPCCTVDSIDLPPLYSDYNQFIAYIRDFIVPQECDDGVEIYVKIENIY